MPTIFDSKPGEIVEKAAEELKKEIIMPEWAKFVKTGIAKKYPPAQADWYFKRAASILRKVYLYGPIGTSKLRTKYGSKKDRGHARERYKRAAGKIIRNILQQLEKKGFIKQGQKGVHKGRIVTPKGRSFLDKINKHGSRKPTEQKTGGAPGASKETARAPTAD